MRHPALLAVALLTAGCGYHTTGSANLLPKNIRTIALVPWGNATTQYKLSSYMVEALSRELIARTGYTVIADPGQADATIYGSIVNIFQNATIYDPISGRGTGAQIIAQVQVRMIGKDGKVLFNRPNMEFRDRYEISVDPKQYLDESAATMVRLSKDVARTAVSAILSDF